MEIPRWSTLFGYVIISLALSSAGLYVTTWQFWVVMFSVMYVHIISAISTD